MASLFKSESGKKEILALYDQKLKELNITYKSLYIDTTWGKTHVIITGNSSNPPLILVHGANGCAPVALESYPNLSSKFQVFAIDVIAQPNKSEETKISMKDDSYGKWMNEIIDKLAISKVTLVGFSFGGLIILKTLAHNSKNIKEAFLAFPAYIVNGNTLKALFKIFIPMRQYMKSQKMKYLEKFLSAFFTERDEFAILFMSKVLLHFNLDFTPVPTLSKEEAKKIKRPITLIAAKNDIMFPGIKMIKRAQKLLPSLKQTLLLEESKHVANKKGNLIIEKLILKENKL